MHHEEYWFYHSPRPEKKNKTWILDCERSDIIHRNKLLCSVRPWFKVVKRIDVIYIVGFITVK